MPVLKLFFMAMLFANLLVAGCAVQPRSSDAMTSSTSSWTGRLALRVDSTEPQAQAMAFAAGFELSGNAQSGQLALLTPLGTTFASLSWTERTAVMRGGSGDDQHFESLAALIKNTLGTEVPVAALFAWLAGDNMSTAGWSADLSRYADGSILARRSQPLPAAEIRLLLEK